MAITREADPLLRDPRALITVDIRLVALPSSSPMGYAYGYLAHAKDPVAVRVEVERYPTEVLGELVARNRKRTLWTVEAMDVSRDPWDKTEHEWLPDTKVWEPAKVPA